MLRFGVVPLLVWHFTVDALYTALLLLRSENAYYVVSGAVAAGILLVPLALSLAVALRGAADSQPAAGLTNGDDGFVPDPLPAEAAPAELVSARVRPLSRRPVGLRHRRRPASRGGLPRSDRHRRASGRGRDRPRGRASRSRVRFLQRQRRGPRAWSSVSLHGHRVRRRRGHARGQAPGYSGIPGFSEAAARYVVDQGGPAAFRRLAQAPAAARLLGRAVLSSREEGGVEGPRGRAPRARRRVRPSDRRGAAAAGAAPPEPTRARARATPRGAPRLSRPPTTRSSRRRDGEAAEARATRRSSSSRGRPASARRGRA